MKKRVIIIVFFALLAAMLAGCWNRRELNTLAIIKAVGLDKSEDGQIDLSVQILKPSEIKASSGGKKGGGGSAGGKGVWVLTSSGKTILDAFRNATYESERKLFTAHNKVYVIGEELARSGIGPVTDLFDRDSETRNLAYIFIAKGKAQDIIEATHEQEKIPAQAIENMIKAISIASSKVPEVSLHELLKTVASKTSDLFIPGITVMEKKEDETVKKLVKLDDTAIFNEDRLIGWFDWKETRGLLWILGKVKSGVIVVPSPLEESKDVSIEIIKASSKIKPDIVNGKLIITISIKEEGNFEEQESQKVDLTKPSNFKELEKRHAAAIRDEINAAIAKAVKEWGVDIFKFGEAFHRKFPKEWKELKINWDKEFQNIEIIVDVDAQLKLIGVSTAPEKVEEEEE